MHKPSTLKLQFAQHARDARGSLSLLLFLVLPFGLLACPGNSAQNGTNNTANVTANTPASVASPTASQPATATTAPTGFDGDRAFEHVRKQVEFGPRPPGSPELAKTRDYIVGELKSYGLNVTQDEFNSQTPVGQRKMVNVTAELPGESSEVVMFSSHYDTKLIKKFRFVGANDAGSSTGALMELARVLASRKEKPRFTYWFVFFDGEEAFCENWEDCGKPNTPDNTYGSRHFVAQLTDKKELKRVRAMILLDMMGYKNLEFGRDDMSTTWLVDAVWQTARELGYDEQFQDHPEGVGGDDHEPFLRAGIDSLDIIQLNTYPFWHKAEDTLDKVSPRSLKIVGETLLASLPRIEQHLLNKRAS
jgi:glutaminyl-peptide cyclotransferase